MYMRVYVKNTRTPRIYTGLWFIVFFITVCVCLSTCHSVWTFGCMRVLRSLCVCKNSTVGVYVWVECVCVHMSVSNGCQRVGVDVSVRVYVIETHTPIYTVNASHTV